MSAIQDELQLKDEDLHWVESLIKQNGAPLPLEEAVSQLAYRKMSLIRGKRVKIFNPEIDYEIGDFIYKYYDEKLKVGKEKVEHFQGGVILQVIGKFYSSEYKCQLIEVWYDGGGLFKQHFDYMRKTNAQILIPCGFSGRSEPVEYLKEEDDPRVQEPSLDKKYLIRLKKELENKIKKSEVFISCGNNLYLEELIEGIPDNVIDKIENYLNKKGESENTDILVEKILKINPNDKKFTSYCISLYKFLESKGKNRIVRVSSEGWGKWNTLDYFNRLKQDIPLAVKEFDKIILKIPKIEALNEKKRFYTALKSKENASHFRFYLTWREIISGGLGIPKDLSFIFENERELIFLDKDKNKSYKVFYYPEDNFILGLSQAYEEHSPFQGALLFLEKEAKNKFSFSFRKSKKILTSKKVYYDAQTQSFKVSSEIIESHAEVNKLIFLEDELEHLEECYKEVDKMDNLLDLMYFLFKKFGIESENYKLHILKCYHICDLLRKTSKEKINLVLFGNPEFFPSEEEKGYFYLDLSKLEKPEEEEKIFTMREGKEPETYAELEEKKEDEGKKGAYLKELEELKKIEEKRKARKFDRDFRGRKGMRRIIEEKIELEEKEKELDYYVKTQEEISQSKEIKKGMDQEVVKPAKDYTKISILGNKLDKILSKKEK
ncbi:MAG: hypothetical protein AB1410_04600 [Acidobacteriota bacterium]